MLDVRRITLFLSFALLIICNLNAEPIDKIDFSKAAYENEAFFSIPVTGYNSPESSAGVFTVGDSYEEGYRIGLNPGEAILLASKNPVQVHNDPVVITLEYSLLNSSTQQPQVAVVGLNAPNGEPDGQLGYFYSTKANTDASKNRLHLVYSPPSGSFMPAVQVSLDQAAESSCTIAVYSLTVYPFDPQNTQETTSFDFATPIDPLVSNVNGDTGSALQDSDNEALILSTTGNGAAANIQLTAANGDQEEKLVTVSFDVTRNSGQDGYTTAVLVHATQTIGLFVKNSALPENQKAANLLIGASLTKYRSPTYLYLQNGGGQESSATTIDNVKVNAYSMDSIQGLPIIETSDLLPRNLAAAVVMPKTLFSGSKGSFSITALNSDNQSPVILPFSVSLINEDQQIPLAKGTTNSRGFASKTFSMPQIKGGNWNVEVKSGQNVILKGQAAVKDSALLVINTDKPIYKPGQKIQGRVLLMNNALQPLQGDIVLSIADAKGIKIHKETLTANQYGVDSFELPLATELNFGTWKISATSGSESKTELDVEVDKYVLPAFEVNLNLAKDWFLVDERIAGTVDSKYFFGKTVKGKVHISAMRYVSTWEEYASIDGTLEDGIYDFDLPAVEYIAGTQSAEGAGTVQIKVTVTDDTGKEESTDYIASIVDAGVMLKIIPESPVVKPGLNQELIIISETPGGAPLSLSTNIEINFMNEAGEDLETIKDTVETINGMALYSYDAPEKTQIVVITSIASVDGKKKEETLLQYAAYSPGANYIHLRQKSEGTLKAGDQAVFELLSTNPGTFFYDVYGDGRTLFSNATDNKEIRFTVTPEMSPLAKVVAYMIQPNNEISADVLPFVVELAPSASLSVVFDAEEVEPGDPIGLNIESDGQAMVGVSIVDESVFALVKGRLNLKNVFAELERIFMEPQMEVHANPDSPWMDGPVTGGKGADDIFQENNLQVLTTSELNAPKAKELDPWILWNNQRLQKNMPIPFPSFEDDLEAVTGGAEDDAYQEPDRVRTFFPETWLWMPELLTDGNGLASLDLTAPDNITTWKLQAVSTNNNGLGIASGSLRVFQDFFTDPDLPYSVIRGDEFPLRVRIFNYVDQEQTIRVTLKDPETLGFEGEAVQQVVIPGQSAGSVSFTLKPDKVGVFPVFLIAQSTTRADAIRKDLLVEPEGMRREQVHNGTLKDATERIIILSFPEIIFEEKPIDGNITLPPIEPPFFDIVPDSETLRVAITPSLIGQSIDGLDDLLGMPYGCGEQNMIFLAPDIEVLRYLKATAQLAPEIRAKVEHFITTGYQRQLTYRRDDGSFSAFGQQDDEGSLWLTSFVLSTFSNAREVRHIDEKVLSTAANWITNHQNDDGSWDPVGFVIHSELVGGMEGNIALSAYATIALIEYGDANSPAIQKAIAYLESNITNEKADSYVLSQIAYALTKAESPQAGAAVERLLELAIVDGNGMHWEPHSIEATAYAALSLILQNPIQAQSALQWIASQRNGLGGYGSTQDTVVAFKAMTAAASEQSRDLNAQIDVIVDGETVHTFTVNKENFDVLQSLELPPTEQITLKMTGTGTVMYQAVHGYNIPAQSEPIGNDMILKVSYSSEHVAVDDIVDVNVTVDYMGFQEKTGMAIVDVSIPTGFALVQDSIEKVKTMEIIKRVEQAGRKIIFYIDHFTSGETLEFSFQVNALFPVKADSGTHSAYLYYDTDKRAETGGTKLQVD